MATSMPVEEVLEKEPRDCGADLQPQAVQAVKRGRGRPLGTRAKVPRVCSNQARAESVSGEEGGEERSVNSRAGVGARVADLASALVRLRGKGRGGGGGCAAAANQGAAVCTKKQHDKVMSCIPQGRPRQNNPPHNAPGPSPSDSTAADPKNDTEQTDSHPDFVQADVDANPESGSFPRGSSVSGRGGVCASFEQRGAGSRGCHTGVTSLRYRTVFGSPHSRPGGH
eukprot:927763-Rhodomonas_salina.1